MDFKLPGRQNPLKKGYGQISIFSPHIKKKKYNGSDLWKEKIEEREKREEGKE